MAQGGNVWEWMESAYDGSNNTAGESRELRGGAYYYSGSNDLNASLGRYSIPAEGFSFDFGFRVASVPEPSAFSLLAIGLGGLAILRRRRS
jgi:hypothetical protein